MPCAVNATRNVFISDRREYGGLPATTCPHQSEIYAVYDDAPNHGKPDATEDVDRKTISVSQQIDKRVVPQFEIIG